MHWNFVQLRVYMNQENSSGNFFLPWMLTEKKGSCSNVTWIGSLSISKLNYHRTWSKIKVTDNKPYEIIYIRLGCFSLGKNQIRPLFPWRQEERLISQPSLISFYLEKKKKKFAWSNNFHITSYKFLGLFLFAGFSVLMCIIIFDSL